MLKAYLSVICASLILTNMCRYNAQLSMVASDIDMISVIFIRGKSLKLHAPVSIHTTGISPLQKWVSQSLFVPLSLIWTLAPAGAHPAYWNTQQVLHYLGHSSRGWRATWGKCRLFRSVVWFFCNCTDPLQATCFQRTEKSMMSRLDMLALVLTICRKVCIFQSWSVVQYLFFGQEQEGLSQ